MIRLFSVGFSRRLIHTALFMGIHISLDLVFIMDCTGSMGSYIASATANIRSIVEEIVVSEKSDIHLALIEYRDHPPQVSYMVKGKGNVDGFDLYY